MRDSKLHRPKADEEAGVMHCCCIIDMKAASRSRDGLSAVSSRTHGGAMRLRDETAASTINRRKRQRVLVPARAFGSQNFNPNLNHGFEQPARGVANFLPWLPRWSFSPSTPSSRPRALVFVPKTQKMILIREFQCNMSILLTRGRYGLYVIQK